MENQETQNVAPEGSELTLYTLKVHIINDTGSNLTLQSHEYNTNAPQTVEMGTEFNDTSNWSDISNTVVYTLDYQGTTYTYTLVWLKTSVVGGGNNYSSSISPDDDTFVDTVTINKQSPGTDIVTYHLTIYS